METKFPEGMRLYPPNKNAPPFIKGQVVITVMELHEWLKANWNEKREVRLDLKEGKSGALYFALDTYKREEAVKPEVAMKDYPKDDISPDDIPF